MSELITDFKELKLGDFRIEIMPSDDGYNIDIYYNNEELDYMIMLYDEEEDNVGEIFAIDNTLDDILRYTKNNLRPNMDEKTRNELINLIKGVK